MLSWYYTRTRHDSSMWVFRSISFRRQVRGWLIFTRERRHRRRRRRRWRNPRPETLRLTTGAPRFAFHIIILSPTAAAVAAVVTCNYRMRVTPPGWKTSGDEWVSGWVCEWASWWTGGWRTPCACSGNSLRLADARWFFKVSICVQRDFPPRRVSILYAIYNITILWYTHNSFYNNQMIYAHRSRAR